MLRFYESNQIKLPVIHRTSKIIIENIDKVNMVRKKSEIIVQEKLGELEKALPKRFFKC